MTMVRWALVALAFVTTLTFQACKKGQGERCYLDSDCKEGLICEGKRCLPHISCDKLEKRVTECVDAILTVRNPGRKLTDADRSRYLTLFRSTHLKRCRAERGAYEGMDVGRCFDTRDCTSFARCLLSLEKEVKGVSKR